MSKFKIGDKVRYTDPTTGHIAKGGVYNVLCTDTYYSPQNGTVTYIRVDSYSKVQTEDNFELYVEPAEHRSLNFTAEMLKAHSKEILHWLEGGDVERYSIIAGWEVVKDQPLFGLGRKYRIVPKPPEEFWVFVHNKSLDSYWYDTGKFYKVEHGYGSSSSKYMTCYKNIRSYISHQDATPVKDKNIIKCLEESHNV